MAVGEASGSKESLARTLWNKFESEATFTLYTPFPLFLASGVLKLDTFNAYLGQEPFHFKTFVQGYGVAEDSLDDKSAGAMWFKVLVMCFRHVLAHGCIGDDDAANEAAVRETKELVMQELEACEKFVKEWGINVETIIPADATTEYTEFLLDTASGRFEADNGVDKTVTQLDKTKIAAYTVGAMTPCMRLYAFLGKELQTVVECNGGLHNNHYRDWITRCSSKSFEVLVARTEDLLDKLSVALTDSELEVMEKLYGRAIKLERNFFASQPIDQRSLVPLSRIFNPAGNSLSVFSDFDLTCTVFDSCAILAEIAMQNATNSDHDVSESSFARMSSSDVEDILGLISEAYTDEYEWCLQRILHREKAEEFRYESIYKELEQISDFKKQEISRVLESGVLKGINAEGIKQVGARLKLQKGCTGFFQKIVQSVVPNVNVHIISDCWCADLIRSAFSSGTHPPISQMRYVTNQTIQLETDLLLLQEALTRKLINTSNIL